MTATNQNSTMYAGDHATIRITVTDSDNGGAAKNIAGATIKWGVYDEEGGILILEKTTADAVTITDGLNGICTVALVPADTSTLTPGIYYHEAEVTDADGNVNTVLTGEYTLNPSRV